MTEYKVTFASVVCVGVVTAFPYNFLLFGVSTTNSNSINNRFGLTSSKLTKKFSQMVLVPIFFISCLALLRWFGTLLYSFSFMLCYIVKKVQMQSISATYFAIFGRNIEIFSVNLEFKKYGKICTRKTPHLAIFHAVCIENLGHLMWWQTPFILCSFSLLNFRVYELFEQMLLRNCNCNKNGNSKLR